MKHISLMLAVLLSAVIVSCKKTLDAPPVKTVPVGGFKTIDSLRAWYNNNGKQMVKVRVDASINLVITADETSGNIYKEVYARDVSGKGVDVKLMSSGGLYLGDSIRLNLNGSTIEVANGQLQIDSVTVDNQVTKIATLVYTAPKVITVAQLDTTYESQLIQINGVEFADLYKGKTYADAVNHQNTSYSLHECGSTKSAVAYTSGYANFANQVIPSANGSIIAIAKRYNTGMELIFRNYSEIHLVNAPCGDAVDTLYETFSGGSSGQNIAVSGWTNYIKQGSQAWETYTATPASAANPSASTGYSAGDARNEMWLVTPPIINSATKYLTFKNATKYNSGGTIQLFLYVSTNYDGANVPAATWTPITTDQISTSSTFFQTQQIAFNSPSQYNGNTNILNNYNGKFYVAFKFVANKVDSLGSYYIDNVKISN